MITDKSKLLDHLDHALEHVLATRLGLKPVVPIEPPTDALDAALTADNAVQEARAKILDTLEILAQADAGWGYLLRIEEAVNALIAAAADVGFRVGLLLGGEGAQLTGKAEENVP